VTLTSNPFPDPQVLLAAGLSDLAALAAPDGPSEAKPAVRAPMASRKKPTLERPSAFEERRRDGAATMPPPKVVSKFEPPRRLSSAARQTPIACVDATPTHDAVGRKRPVATPPTDLVSLGAELSPTAANKTYGESAVAANALATPNDSDASGRTTRRFASARSTTNVRDEKETRAEDSAPAETNVPSPVTVVANARRAANELLSPATAAAVETLAGVGATAARASRSAGAENDDAAVDFSFSAKKKNEDGKRGLSGSEALYSKFAAAATEPPDKDARTKKGAAVFPSAFPAPETFSLGATRVPRKKRRTLSEAVEQFQLETEKAAAEEMLAMRNVPLGVHFGVTLEAFSAPNGTPREEAEKVSAAALFAALAPPPKKRKPRRWLSEDEKVFTCGIDGCARSYGSASSLCAHKRAHHPDWKERRDRQRRAEAEAAAARGEEAEDAENDDDNDDENDDEDDVAGRQARKEGSKALDASARLTPSGAWIESLAADAHARLGALRRSRQRVQRGVRDARAATSALTDAKAASPEPSADAVAAAAATRLLQNMETALEAEADQLSAWLEKLERVAELRQNAGRALFAAEEDEALLGEGFAAAAAAMGPLEAREAARTAREARAALAGSAAAFGAKKEKKEKPADRG
jgi:hypothetical protein